MNAADLRLLLESLMRLARDEEERYQCEQLGGPLGLLRGACWPAAGEGHARGCVAAA